MYFFYILLPKTFERLTSSRCNDDHIYDVVASGDRIRTWFEFNSPVTDQVR
jgi:hypothetical protein